MENKNAIALKAENGLSFGEMQSMAGVLLKSGFLPSAIKTEAQALTIMLTGKELGLGLMESLRSINVIQGKPTMSAQLLLGLCYRTGEVEKAFFEKETAEEAVFILKRKGNEPIKGVFSIADAKRMGYGSKDNWVKQPATMLKWRAISAACRMAFPDAISGVYETTEMQDAVQPQPSPQTSSPQLAPAEEVPEIQVDEEPPAMDEVDTSDEIPDEKLGQWIMPNGKYEGLSLSQIAGRVTETGKAIGVEYLEFVAEKAKDPKKKNIISRFVNLLQAEMEK